ncbi:hypothetical protein BpHYR1_038449 [Brachionus plicatilis]|uniref:Uncharacterized protein n=1 Tax=Brachionus plicatilis TaxID=10195 RepID=A0A3M7Q612_BRAPC|nr:hypothetical protein BpHYR1_038449 [Brachionus plicatilis]
MSTNKLTFLFILNFTRKNITKNKNSLNRPSNEELFEIPSSLIQDDTPISTVFNSVESNQIKAASSNNSNENTQMRGKGRPKKVDSVQKAEIFIFFGYSYFFGILKFRIKKIRSKNFLLQLTKLHNLTIRSLKLDEFPQFPIDTCSNNSFGIDYPSDQREIKKEQSLNNLAKNFSK